MAKHQNNMQKMSKNQLTSILMNQHFHPKKKISLLNLLHKNSDIFPKGPYDKGCTHLQEIKIEIHENATTVCMSFYKQNPKMRRETEIIHVIEYSFTRSRAKLYRQN